MKTLYLSDLDGTLLDSGGQISAYTCQVINGLLEDGMLFTYATARSVTSASIAVRGLRVRLPVITYNGAIVLDPCNRSIVSHSTYAPEQTVQIRRILQANRSPVVVYALQEGCEKVSWIPENAGRGIAHYLSSRQGDPRLNPVDSWEKLFAGELFYFSVIGDREQTEALYPLLQGAGEHHLISLQRDIYNPEDWWLEVQQARVSKAVAALELKKALGADRMVCFGDHVNDIPLFAVCEESYAVANAHPELLPYATGRIASNDGDGVARWLLEHRGGGSDHG